MAARALVRESDLRRWAKIAREEGVAIQSRIDPAGGVTIHMSAAQPAPVTASDDLDARLDAFGAM